MNREDFNILNNNIIYFDSAATSLKPRILTDTLTDYYNNYSSNVHRGDYDIGIKAETMYEISRNKVAKFINANTDEIVFTSGTTDSLNKIIQGYFYDYLNDGDEVLTTQAEHASLILPLFELKDKKNISIKYIPLNSEYTFTLDDLKNSVTSKTKVIALSYITNIIGDIRSIKEIVEYAHKNNIKILVDAAQAAPHKKIDVKDLDVDFLAFSMHKMLGPTGVGILYGKKELLLNTKPIIVGGGMNASFESDGTRVYSELPHNLEAGTPNISGVIATGAIIDYINSIGIEKIEEYEIGLKKYLIEKLESNSNIVIYNKNTSTGLVTFNYKGLFSQDLAIILNKYNICVRAGNHCSKLFKNELGVKNTVRISFYLYNTKEEIDKLVSILNNPNLVNEII